ncbi:hypothetical protein J6590_056605 [Homalodisca vitripennis]|nr:hypothetical protein J6590_056605 [Homalodisca vitripennis]
MCQQLTSSYFKDLTSPLPLPIVVDEVTRKPLSARNLYHNFPDTQIYTNEHLTKKTIDVFTAARKTKRSWPPCGHQAAGYSPRRPLHGNPVLDARHADDCGWVLSTRPPTWKPCLDARDADDADDYDWVLSTRPPTWKPCLDARDADDCGWVPSTRPPTWKPCLDARHADDCGWVPSTRPPTWKPCLDARHADDCGWVPSTRPPTWKPCLDARDADDCGWH